jgi:hypothetical protein
VIRHRLRATRIFGERRGRNFQLPCQPLNQRLDGLLKLRQGNPGWRSKAS